MHMAGVMYGEDKEDVAHELVEDLVLMVNEGDADVNSAGHKGRTVFAHLFRFYPIYGPTELLYNRYFRMDAAAALLRTGKVRVRAWAEYYSLVELAITPMQLLVNSQVFSERESAASLRCLDAFLQSYPAASTVHWAQSNRGGYPRPLTPLEDNTQSRTKEANKDDEDCGELNNTHGHRRLLMIALVDAGADVSGLVAEVLDQSSSDHDYVEGRFGLKQSDGGGGSKSGAGETGLLAARRLQNIVTSAVSECAQRDGRTGFLRVLMGRAAWRRRKHVLFARQQMQG